MQKIRGLLRYTPVIGLFGLFAAFTSCSSGPKFYDLKNSDDAISFDNEKTKYGIGYIKQTLFAQKSSWPILYASSSNTNFLLGEKLQILDIAFKLIKLDKGYSSDIAYTIDGQTYEDIYGNWTVPHEMDRFDSLSEMNNSYSYSTSLRSIFDRILVQTNILVRGENGKTQKYSTVIELTVTCANSQQGCEISSQVVDSPASYIKNFLTKNLKSVKAKIITELNTISLVDPLEKYRNDSNVLSRLQRRILWRGMSKEEFNILNINTEYGTFQCDQLSKSCRSGYSKIGITNNIVTDFEFSLKNRKM